MFSEVNFLTQQVSRDHLLGFYPLFSTRIPINFPRKEMENIYHNLKGNTNNHWRTYISMHRHFFSLSLATMLSIFFKFRTDSRKYGSIHITSVQLYKIRCTLPEFPKSVDFDCCGHAAESSIEVTCNFSIKSKFFYGAETLTLAQNSVTR